MLDVKDIKKTFNKGTVNEKKALQGLSLHLNDGDFVRWPNFLQSAYSKQFPSLGLGKHGRYILLFYIQAVLSHQYHQW